MAQTVQACLPKPLRICRSFPARVGPFSASPLLRGSIHRLKMKKGTRIPAHTHPPDEYILVVSGSIKTGERVCDAGCFWSTPQGTR